MSDDERLCLACGEYFDADEDHECEESEQMSKRDLRDMRDAARGDFPDTSDGE